MVSSLTNALSTLAHADWKVVHMAMALRALATKEVHSSDANWDLQPNLLSVQRCSCEKDCQGSPVTRWREFFSVLRMASLGL